MPRTVRARTSPAPAPAAVAAPANGGVPLDNLFRRNSKARVVAERLLSGKQMTRDELVADLKLSATTVPRVVDQLESVGVRIARETDPHTRHASYRVVQVSADEPEHPRVGRVAARYAAQTEPLTVQMTRIEVENGDVIATYTSDVLGTRRGLVVPVGDRTQIPPHLLAEPAQISALCIMDTGALAVQIGDLNAHVLIADLDG